MPHFKCEGKTIAHLGINILSCYQFPIAQSLFTHPGDHFEQRIGEKRMVVPHLAPGDSFDRVSLKGMAALIVLDKMIR